LRLRQEGLTFRAIGEHFGVGAQRAQQLVNRGARVADVDLPETKWTLAAAKAQATRKTREAEWQAAQDLAEKAYRAELKRNWPHRRLWECFTDNRFWRRHPNWRNNNGSLHAWFEYLDRHGGNELTYRVPGQLAPVWHVDVNSQGELQ
jgi:transposase